MKKALFLLFFICLFMVPALADYTVDNVSVSAEVSLSGKTHVSMNLQMTFDASTSEVTIPLPCSDVSRLSVSDFRYKTEKTDTGTDVILKKRSGFMGTQTFSLSYTVPAAEDNDEEADDYHLGLLSSQLGKAIPSCSFTVVMPEKFDAEPQIISGYHGALSPEETGLTVTETALSGSVTDRMAFDSLAVELILPQEYFTPRSTRLPGIAVTWLSGVMLAVFLLCIIYWRLKIRTPRTAGEPRLLLPEGVLPCQLPMVLDGSTCDIPAMILQWANLGYLSISLSKRGQVILTKTMQMGTERSKAERQFFDRIFQGKPRVAAAPGRFTLSATQFRSASRKALRSVIFDPTGGNLVLIQTPCRILLAIGTGCMAVHALPEGAGFIVLGVMLGLIGLVYSLYLHTYLVRFFSLRTVTILSIPLFAVVPLLMVGGLLSGAVLEMLLGLSACFFSAAVSARGPRRNQRGVDAMAQARGCRTFYRQVTWQKLQILQGENRGFFQSQLPSTVALGVDKQFAKRFERLSIPKPEWLDVPGAASMSASALQKLLTPILRQLRDSFR